MTRLLSTGPPLLLAVVLAAFVAACAPATVDVADHHQVVEHHVGVLHVETPVLVNVAPAPFVRVDAELAIAVAEPAAVEQARLRSIALSDVDGYFDGSHLHGPRTLTTWRGAARFAGDVVIPRG